MQQHGSAGRRRSHRPGRGAHHARLRGGAAAPAAARTVGHREADVVDHGQEGHGRQEGGHRDELRAAMWGGAEGDGGVWVAEGWSQGREKSGGRAGWSGSSMQSSSGRSARLCGVVGVVATVAKRHQRHQPARAEQKVSCTSPAEHTTPQHTRAQQQASTPCGTLPGGAPDAQRSGGGGAGDAQAALEHEAADSGLQHDRDRHHDPAGQAGERGAREAARLLGCPACRHRAEPPSVRLFKPAPPAPWPHLFSPPSATPRAPPGGPAPRTRSSFPSEHHAARRQQGWLAGGGWPHATCTCRRRQASSLDACGLPSGSRG